MLRKTLLAVVWFLFALTPEAASAQAKKEKDKQALVSQYHLEKLSTETVDAIKKAYGGIPCGDYFVAVLGRDGQRLVFVPEPPTLRQGALHPFRSVHRMNVKTEVVEAGGSPYVSEMVERDSSVLGLKLRMSRIAYHDSCLGDWRF